MVSRLAGVVRRQAGAGAGGDVVAGVVLASP